MLRLGEEAGERLPRARRNVPRALVGQGMLPADLLASVSLTRVIQFFGCLSCSCTSGYCDSVPWLFVILMYERVADIFLLEHAKGWVRPLSPTHVEQGILAVSCLWLR